MKIARIEYSLMTSSLDIFISGCKGPHCEKCYNPELWDFNVGEEYNQEFLDNKILPYISDFNLLIDKIIIVGGEPLDAPIETLRHLLRGIKEHSNIDIYLFTHYNIEDIPNNIKHYTDYIKCGRFEPSKTNCYNYQHGIELASHNQEIYCKGLGY